MPFVKLNESLLDSSLWGDIDGTRVFCTALLMADPYEVTEATNALGVRSLESIGFTVEPDWYGLVKSSGIGIVRRALLDEETGMAALARLSSPDPDSRTPAHEGRRMVRIPDGWIVLNYDAYRRRDVTAAERMRRYRERRKQDCDQCDDGVTRNDRNVTANVTEAEAEAEVEVEVEVEVEEGGKPPLPADEFMRLWNDVAKDCGLPICRHIKGGRLTSFKARLNDPDFRDNWREALSMIRSSSFLQGKSERGWKVSIDWILKPDGITKILEGRYHDGSKHQEFGRGTDEDRPF